MYVKRVQGPELDPGVFPLGQWIRYLPDYVVRETNDRCGPEYLRQTEAVECDLYVHDFPQGLPPGRYTFYVQWKAPCLVWFPEACERPAEIISLFESQVDSAFYSDDFQEDEGDWPRELWQDAEPIP